MNLRDLTYDFGILIDHISLTYKADKGFEYEFTSQEINMLKDAARIYNEFGLMALWDKFLTIENKFTKNSRHSVRHFINVLNWLVDDKIWKKIAIKYCTQYYPYELSEPLTKNVLRGTKKD